MKRIAKNSAFVFCAIALSAASALAAGRNEVRVVVPYGDLNLAHPAGAQALLYRIDRAAGVVCGGVPDVRDVARLARHKSCKTAIVQDAVNRVGHPQLHRAFGHPLARVATE
jgi:UrcA family protein